MVRTILFFMLIACNSAWAIYPAESGPNTISPGSEVVLGDVPSKMSLNPLDGVSVANVTFYNPDMHGIEGGPRNRHGEPVNSFEDAQNNGRAVTLAADYLGSFGRECNQKTRRCTLLVFAKGFDKLFPNYRKRFPGLPKDSFVGIIEDTGSAFYGKGDKRFDLASRSRALARSVPGWFGSNVKWVKLQNPCGDGVKGRNCDFSEAVLSAEFMGKTNLPDSQNRREANLGQSRRQN